MVDEEPMSQSQCIVCESRDILPFIEILQVPVHCNLLWRTRAEASNAPLGDIILGRCMECGHIFNLAFKPELVAYGLDYDNSLNFSPRFQSYAIELASDIVQRYKLHGKLILEIGSGQGDFLNLLCEIGGNRGIGFDPSYVPDEGMDATSEDIVFIQDFYSEKYLDVQADFICSRQLLEHLYDPPGFLKVISRAQANKLGVTVFFEVPNVVFTLRQGAIWDIIYEHCSYFSPQSLRNLFRKCNFQVLRVQESYEGQFLCIEAGLTNHYSDLSADRKRPEVEIDHAISGFAMNFRNKIKSWSDILEQISNSRKRAVVWGAGSKGATFLNAFKEHSPVEYIVDINPRKWDNYVAGTGVQIVSPGFLNQYRPDVIIVTNAIYAEEIREMTRKMGLVPEFLYA